MGAKMSFGASSTSDLSHNVSMAANVSSGALSSGASSSSDQWKYEVFLSFCGEDTRTNFTNHLFDALVREGFQIFREEDELNRGEDISSEVMAAIEDSRVAIIVFSQNYASSTWCLGELLKILDCKRDSQIEKVLPVFYKIDSSDVRKQSNTYSQAFKTHEERFQKKLGKVQRWRDALTEAANLVGWDFVDGGHEWELIKDIVKAVLTITNPTGGCLHVAKFPTGLHSHVEAIRSLLNEGGSDVVRIIGIYGPCGIGKTTIAKAVFNIMSRNFDGSCFLAGVSEVSNQQGGSLCLQKQLFSDIWEGESIDICDEHQGIFMLSEYLPRKRVLIVFDDVVEMIHLIRLVGSVRWFFRGFDGGSRIVLTTRDENLLKELNIDETYNYRVETMDENESLRLFCRHAFRQDHPSEGYENLSEKVVHYAGGLPLALVILGSLLYKRTPIEGECQLEKLKEKTIEDVSKNLKISYDLLDKFDQRAFLDISCFFVGMDKDRLSMILDAGRLNGAAAIKILKERSLVTIDENFDKLRMHHLIRDVGRGIVRKECIEDPGKRSRVWNIDDAIGILRNLTGTRTIEGFQLLIPPNGEGHEYFGKVNIKGFSRMPNLRFLQVNCGLVDARENTIDWEEFRQEEVISFKNLVFLDWFGFPFKCIPDNFHLRNLVILQMCESRLIKVWERTKDLKMLKVLNLSYSLDLTHMPDFSGLRNLERLDLRGCCCLVEVHESIRCLKKLVELNLSKCSCLTNLPCCINELESLEVLNVSSCPVLGNLPKGFGKLKCLRMLNLSECNCTDDDIAGCGLGEIYSLESLNLSYNRFKSLPMLPSSLQSLKLRDCYNLERLPHLSNFKQLKELDVEGCKELIGIEGLEGLKPATFIDLPDCQKLETSVKKRIFQANMSSGALSSRASSSSRRWKYDVFLSFCGEDTRTNFTDHLFDALVREGILTFRDNEELNRGEDISSELMAAIENSRVAIIVFSQNYASSTWCLGELLKILDCKRDGQIERVLPVFYKIDPSDVRKQSNNYSQAFKTHEKCFQKKLGKVQRWRDALIEAANLAGWDQRKVADGHESDLIKDIVKEVLAITNPTGGCLHVAKFPTGLDSHVEAICSLLNEGRSNVVRTVGMYGPGGIGKTTIAKAVFNIMSRNFDSSCFLAGVREVSSQQEGSLRLQKQLLSVILKRQGIEIHDEHQGINMINKCLRCKRVLIVFDDVVKMTHLDNLVRGFNWFCPGSRIILTTRDEHLLTELDMDEKCTYRVEIMDEKESLRLLCRHAFIQDRPLEGYEKLSKSVVHYAGGLPLALVTLGSLLYKREPVEWKCQLEKLKEIPLNDVSEKLKISYDLLDKLDQSAFLDISCFFVGMDKDWLSMILDACYPSGVVVIKSLKERSLVTINEFDDKLAMHDLIKDMGREIVRNESIKNPGERSRVWNIDDAIDILSNLTGTRTIEGFQLLKPPNGEEHEYFGKVNIKGFSRMSKLRFLQVNCGLVDARESTIDWEESHQEEVISFKNLVFLDWFGFPFKCIPDNFHLRNLVILQMRESRLIKVWERTKNLKMLKVLNLSYSLHLTHMPDFSGLRNLERLDLRGCYSLVEVYESIRCLKKLVELNLSECRCLTNLPCCINELESLEVLNVSYCQVLGNLPKGFGKLTRLRMLNLSDCDRTDDDIAGCGLGEIYSLESLNLSENKFKSLPMLPSSLRSLMVRDCYNLERLPHLSNLKQLQELDLEGCKEVIEIEGLEGLKSATFIDLRNCHKLESSVKKRIFQDICKEFGDGNVCDIFLPGSEVPDWFDFQNDDGQEIAQRSHLKMQPQQGLIICTTFRQPHLFCDTIWFHVEVFDSSKNCIWKHAKEIPYDEDVKMITWVIKISNTVWKSIVAENEDGETVTISAYCVLMQYDMPIKRNDPSQIGHHIF